MNIDKALTFEEIYERNKRRVYYHIHKLNIHGTVDEFYQEGLLAMWNAYEKYDPDRGSLATYFNYAIRNRLIDLLRKKTRDKYYDDIYSHEERVKIDNGNRCCRSGQSVPGPASIPITDADIWKEIKLQLTEKQWKWIECFILLDMSVMEIAAAENASVEAVKSWGRQVRRKLRNEEFRKIIENLSSD